MKLSASRVHQVDGDAAVTFGDVDETEGVQVGLSALAGAGEGTGAAYGAAYGWLVPVSGSWPLVLLGALFSATTAQ